MGRLLALAVVSLFGFTLPGCALGADDSAVIQRGRATYYVAANGLDSNSGDQAHPFREIRKGLSAASAGDTVLVADGSYLGFDVSGRHGSEGSNITIKAQGANSVVTTTTDRSDNRDTIHISDSSYLVIEGLRSFNGNRAAMRISQSDFITARNCTFGNNALWAIFTDFSDDLLVEGCELYGSGSQHGIYFSNSGDRPTARNNTIHDNYGCGIHMNGDASMGGDGLITGGLIEGNVIYNNGVGGGGGINMDGVQNTVVQNNVLYNNHASGIVNFRGDGAAGPSGNVFYHNTVDMASNARWALQISETAGPVKVRNNILYDRNPNRGGLALGDANDVANVDSDYNIMDRVTPDGWSTIYTLAQWQSMGHEAHSLSAAPSALFVNDAAADYHLRDGSPAIDKGETLAAVAFDKAGKKRPVGNFSDIGAYEWGTPEPPDTTAPAAITDLVISNITHTTVNLTWTAPGGDGMNGTAASYDLRHSKSGISEAGWKNATKVSQVPIPRLAGNRQWCLVSGLVQHTTYHFAIRAIDQNNNTAGISNVVSGTTLRVIPNLFIAPSDIAFSNDAPTEGDTLTVSASFHAVNLTSLINIKISLLVDGNASDSQTLGFNSSFGFVEFGWRATAGNRSIGIRLDPGDLVEETDKTDNFASRVITVAELPPPPLPDLTIAPADISFSTNAPLEGELVVITARIRAANITQEVGFPVELRADNLTVSSASLKLNATTTIWRANWTAVRGTHELSIVVDAGLTLNESDETNNSASRRIFVGAPDIFISQSDIFIPAKSPLEGTVLDVSATFHAVNLTRPVSIVVAMLVDGVPVNGSPVNIDGPAATVGFNWTAQKGWHNISIDIDSAHSFSEEFEANNIATVSIFVREKPAAPRPDLSVGPGDIALLTRRPVEGDNLTVTVTVHAAHITQELGVVVALAVDGRTAGELTVGLASGSAGRTIQFFWTAVKGVHNLTVSVRRSDKTMDADPSNDNTSTNVAVAAGQVSRAGNDNSWTLYGGIGVAAVLAVVLLLTMRRRRQPQ
jgi:parallel beta-helix repeat protein